MRRPYYNFSQGTKQRWNKLKLAAVGVCFVVVGFGGLKLVEVSSHEPDASSLISNASQPASLSTMSLPHTLPWPETGTAAYSIPAENLAVTSAETNDSVPIASLAKIITVLAVMREKPLELGQQGELITMTEHDITLYYEYLQKDGTVTPVTAGQQITQYQALQSIMHVSSNNMADMLAIWAFGSIENYTHYANNMLRELGFKKTRVADDASGFSPDNVSTAKEIAELSYMYLQNPVLREIALQPESSIPLAGTIQNVNAFINEGDAFGLKVGNTDEAGRCFVIASIRETDDAERKTSVAVVLGSEDILTAAEDAAQILKAGNRSYDTLDM